MSLSQQMQLRRAGFGAGDPDFGIPSWVWDDGFNLGPLYGGGDSDSGDVVRISTSAPSVRNAEELAKAIKAAGGKLSVAQGHAALLVALNNTLRFSVQRKPDGSYEITDRLAGNSSILLIGGAAVVVILVVALAGR